MAAVESLRTHLVEELRDLLDAEQQLTATLPQMASAASNRTLRTAFERHLKETEGQIERLKRALERLGETAKAQTCEAMQGLLEEGNSLMTSAPEGPLRDAVMITAAQKVEHYEMASYGTARTYAQVLGEGAVARLLEQTLRQEKAADQKLTQIAESSVNEAAAEQWSVQDEEGGFLQQSASWIGETVAAAPRLLDRAADSVGLGRGRSRGRTARSSSRSQKRTTGAAKRTQKKR